MIINFDLKPLKDGQEVVSKQKVVTVNKDDDGSVTEDVSFEIGTLSLKDCCKESLLKGLAKISIEETMLRYNLYNKIKEGGEIELSEEELSLLKGLVNDRYEILLAGQLLTMLGEK